MRSDRSVLCSGSCGRIFHPGCVGLNATNFKSWTANVGLLWFCENCRVNFNPSIIDREAVIIKTMRDLLIRIDSIDLRVGQFGENLKMLNSVLSLSGSTRRDSNFSPGLRQQFAMSGTTIHDPSDFVNSINRLNFDLSFRSNDANNTIVDVNEGLDATLDNDDPNQESPVVMTTNANSITPTAVSTSATNTVASITTTAAAAAVAAVAVAPCCVTNATASDSTATTVASSYADVASRPTVAVAAAIASTSKNPDSRKDVTAFNTQPTSSSSARGSQINNLAQECRLKVVNRNQRAVRQTSSDEMLKSFYVTPFDIEQSEEDVIEYLRETINVENSTLKCVKLVPRNKNINELSFVSFKLSVSVINDPFYWPEGVEIREFQSKIVNPLNRVVSI